jgi:acyl-CoA synthetase (AMP-forming)/AMP-acid ligase II
MDGYRGRPEATQAVLDGGWLRSGDLGFVRDGELYVVGRAKEVVIVGGKNVHPHDVERIASEVSDAVLGVAAFGVDNPETGTEELTVVVEARGHDEKKAELVRAVRGELLAALGVKVAVHAWPVGAIPRTTSGKVRRAACARALAETPT